MDIARDFLHGFVARGADHWRETIHEPQQRALEERLPRVQAQLGALDAPPDDPDALPDAIEAAVLASIHALPDPQRSAALRHLGFSKESRDKSKTEREDLAARKLSRKGRWFRTPSPRLMGAAPREWLLEQVALHLASENPDEPTPPAPALESDRNGATESRNERSLDWGAFYSAVAELGCRVFADSAYGGFWPDAVVGVNHGGAIVAGLLYYVHSRSFEIFTIAAREGDFVSSAEHLSALAELADRHQRPIRVLLVDDSMKSGESLRLARTVVEAALSGRSATIRMAVLVYRRDYHKQAGNTAAAPDEHVYTDIDHFPYGPV